MCYTVYERLVFYTMEEKKTLDCISISKAQSIITILNAFYSESNSEAIVRSIKNSFTDSIIDSLITELRNSYNIFYTPGMFLDEYGHVVGSNKLVSVNSEDSENDTAKIVEEHRGQLCSALDLPPDANFIFINDTIRDLVYFKNCLMSVLKMLEDEYSIKVYLGSDADTVAKFIDNELTQRCNLADEVFDNQCKMHDEQRKKICDKLGIHPDSSFKHICDTLESLLYYRSLNNKFIELITMLKQEYDIERSRKIRACMQSIADDISDVEDV